MVAPEMSHGFTLRNTIGNAIENTQWHVNPKVAPDVTVNDVGETVLDMPHDRATYVVSAGSSADFSELGEGRGIDLGERNTIFVQSHLAMTGSKNRSIAILEFDQDRQRIGEFFIEVNRLCTVIVQPTTRYILLCLRLSGVGKTSVRLLQADVRDKHTPAKVAMVEYRALSQQLEMSQIDRIEKILERVEKTHNDNPEQVWGSAPETFFSPLNVRSSKIVEKPYAHTAGRLAAEQINSEDSTHMISRLIETPGLSHHRKMLLVGSEWMGEHLQDLGEIVYATPGRELEVLDSDVAYLFIDEDASNGGPWSGVFDAQNTWKFSSLFDLVKAARSNGTVIGVITGRTSGHYTGKLRQAADVLIEDGRANLQWARDIYLPVIHRVESLVQERTNNV